MGALSLLKNIFSNDPSRGPQRLRFIYRVTLTAESAYEGSLILPIPRSGETQEIDGAPDFSTAPARILNDEIYQNSYAVYPAHLKAGESCTLEESLIVQTCPITITINNEWHLSDYKERPREHLESNEYVSPNNPEVNTLAKELMRDTDHIATILIRADAKVQELLHYGNPIPGLYGAAETLRSRTVDCGGYSTLLTSILIACGIPARIVSGFWLNDAQGLPLTAPGSQAMHAWVEAFLPDGSWLPLDPSVSTLRKEGRTKRVGEIGNIGSDRIITSYGAGIPVKIGEELHPVPILQGPILIPATPLIKVDHSIITEKA